ncbi:MAG: N-acetylmuramoyl-L-alanine amidase [Prevotella sp.]
MLILLDPAHGHNTPGKRSPDGTLLEYAYTRDLANQILATLQDKGHNVQLFVPETEDIPLKERVRRANAICTAQGPANVLLISLHINAAGDGTRWHTATGWSCYTTKGHTLADTLADCLYQSAKQHLTGQTIRTDYARDGDPDWEENFYILRHTHCPAVLIENFFMDNKQDLAYLLSQEGRREIIETIIDGIERCVLALVSG